MKRLLCLVLGLVALTATAQRPHIPTRGEVGAAVMPAEIAPIEAPFYMPQLQKPTFPDREVKLFPATDGRLQTKEIQKAIDRLSKQGGGRVTLAAGDWFTGLITLKSNIELHTEEGTTVRFSGEVEDFLPAVFTT
ncbi:MAG: glycoside hydrolase family 28 protein, partial [Alistipes sp.]|nr:glycoside hydrolase family 28 protein [Alistipes sp.]